MKITNRDDCAFPVAVTDDADEVILGMTKREEFAKTAMQGYCADIGTKDWSQEKIAERSVSMADELIKALNK
jgi:hypothetical protein